MDVWGSGSVPRVGSSQVKNVLWTGGWDSTFRVLDIVFSLQKQVQPYYLLDKSRASSGLEQGAMERIRSRVASRDLQAASRIWPLIVVDPHDMKKIGSFESAHARLRRKGHLGRQYPLIAWFAQEYGVKDLELSIHRDDRAWHFVRPHSEKIGEDNDECFRVVKDAPDDVRVLFGNLLFPVLDLTKLDMEKIAKERRYSAVLEETWFCHNPTRRNTPCGVCNPCVYTIREGMGRRVPLAGRLRYYRNATLDTICDILPLSLSWRCRKMMNFLR